MATQRLVDKPFDVAACESDRPIVPIRDTVQTLAPYEPEG